MTELEPPDYNNLTFNPQLIYNSIIMKIKEELTEQNTDCCQKKWIHKGAGPQGAIFGLGFIGALFYFLQQPANFQEVIMGILKAIVWPALLVFKLLSFFNI